MSLTVNKINNINFKANEKPSVENKTSKPEVEKDNGGLSSEQKTLIGLGALAGAVVGGILVKRRIDSKNAAKIIEKAEKLLQKPKEFSYDTLRAIANEWDKAGKIADGDEVLLMGKSIIDELANKVKNTDKYWTKVYKVMDMPDTGFAVVLKKAGKDVDMSTFTYYAPEKITEPLIEQSIKDGKIVVMPVKD